MIGTLLVSICMSGAMVGLSPRVPVEYAIEARLDTATQTVYGHQAIRFLNPTDEPLNQLCFHLYPDAFKDTSTVFCNEDRRVRKNVADGNISRLDISNLKIDGRNVDSNRIRVEGTLTYIDLNRELPPGRETEISLDFELPVPRIIIRFGYDSNGNYLLSHWFPILCGYQKGRLIDWEYHANSEFFSNFGNYTVELTLPSGFVVGSTGALTEFESNDSLTVWEARADTVIDYAFACGPAFEVRESDTLGIRIHYLLEENRLESLERIDRITKYTLAYCSERLFAYPYDDFTLVDLDPGAGGLELPGLVAVDMNQPTRMMTPTAVDATIAHEIVHQWFYSAIATNESEEAWLDEGLTTFLTSEIMDSYSGNEGYMNIFGYRISLSELFRTFAFMEGPSYPIDLKSWEYPDQMEYNAAVYSRASMVLGTLKRVLGDSVFAEALRDFARRYRFGHPTGDDLLNSISSSANVDLSGFSSQFVAGTARVDYAVTSLDYSRVDQDSAEATGQYNISVEVRRRLGGIVPQRITVVLEDGARLDSLWDGQSRLAIFDFVAESEPAYAALDEDGITELDEDRANNRIYRQSLSTRLMSFEWDTIFALESLLSLIL
jgi:hypothetical protein